MVLFVSVILHIVSAYQLTVIDRAARPVPYAKRELQVATIGSRTMRWGGVALAIFILLHLLHFTTLTLQPAPMVAGDVYANAMASFQIWWVTLLYVIAMIFLGLHLYHGLWSSVRTLGFERGRLDPFKRPVAIDPRSHPLGGLHARAGCRVLPPGTVTMELKSRVPEGPIEEKWDTHRFDMKLVNPANKRKYTVIVVGSGLAGGAGAATLAELGYNVKCFCFQDSPRRAHSIAAQGGINAAKNYQNDGDSIYRLFYDTVKGGDFRSREANVYRLAQISVNIIDQCVAQGVPFAREYGGLLANRSFGGAQVSRTFYARGQTGQQLLLGAYQALERQIGKGTVRMYPAHGDARPGRDRWRGARDRDAQPDHRRRSSRMSADAVVLGTGGYGNVFYLSTNAKGSNATAIWRAYKRGAAFANPCYTQIHPTCIPKSGEYQSKLTLMSESLRNDGRVWVPIAIGDKRRPDTIPEAERDYYLERMYPSYGNLAPRDIASRAAKRVCDEGRGVGPTGLGVYLDFASAIARLGEDAIRERYGNLFEMYERITDENPYKVPMRIYPAVHYTMGGLWVDYNLMSTIPGLHVIGEANFSDHGANRLGASALMQGLADGYFIISNTIAEYLASQKLPVVETTHAAFAEAENARARHDEAVSLDQGHAHG